MKNITICLFAWLFIAVCPSLSSALDFGIGDISRQYSDITWDSMNTLSSPDTSGNTNDLSSSTDNGGGGDDPTLLCTTSTGSDTYTYIDIGTGDQEPSSPVPEPATMLLLGTGIVGIVTLRKRFVSRV